jgi:hypothetical protein
MPSNSIKCKGNLGKIIPVALKYVIYAMQNSRCGTPQAHGSDLAPVKYRTGVTDSSHKYFSLHVPIHTSQTGSQPLMGIIGTCRECSEMHCCTHVKGKGNLIIEHINDQTHHLLEVDSSLPVSSDLHHSVQYSGDSLTDDLVLAMT